MAEMIDIDDRNELTSPESAGPQAMPLTLVGPRLNMPQVIPTTCTLFPRFPLELRDMIWEASISEPRIMAVVVHPLRRRPRLDSESRANAVPSLLHTNAEARSMALKKFVPFVARWGKPVYFDFENDILSVELGCLDQLWGARSLCGYGFLFPVDVREWQVKLQHLRIRFPNTTSGIETRVFQWMKSLKTLAIGTASGLSRRVVVQGGRAVVKDETEDDIRATLASYWLGPEGKLPIVTLFAYGDED